MSGSTVGGVVGAAVGFWFGGPAGAQWGWMIGSAVGGYIDPTQIQGPRLSDARTQTSRDGVAIPFGWGVFPTAGNIIWVQPGPPTEHKKTERQGKGGPETTTYTYTRSYAIGICQGPIAGLLQIKRNGKVVYDTRPDATIEAELDTSGLSPAEVLAHISGLRAANAKFIDKCTIYLGDEEQLPDATIESYKGVGNVPAYRGLAYIVVTDDDVTELQGAIPQYEFVVAACGTSTESEVPPGALADWFALQSNISGSTLGASEDGADWSSLPPIATSHAFSRMHATTNRLILWPELAGSTPYYTDDRGATYNELPTIGSISGGTYGSQLIDGRLWVPGGGFGTYYTDDEGDSWGSMARAVNPVFGNVGDFLVVGHSTLLLRGGDGGSLSRSTDGGETWGASVRPFEPTNCPDILCGGCDGSLIVVGGGTDLMLWTADGLTYTACTLPGGLGSGSFRQILPPNVAGERWMAFRRTGSDSSEAILLSVDGKTWTLATGYSAFTITGGAQTAYRHNGRVTVIGESTSDDRVILTTSDEGATWTDCSDSMSGTDPLASISGPPLSWSGAPGDTPVPDAPGWVIKPDGSLEGPGGTSVSPCVPDLATIVAELCEREGLTSDEYDVSQLTDLVPGFRVANEGDAASAISALMPAYFFDISEWDGKLRFIKRGGEAVGSINGDDLVERDGDAFERERVQEAELLRRVTVGYIDPAASFGPTTQKWERRAGTVQARGEASMELPLTLISDSAATIAKKRGLVAWGEPEKQKFSLPYRLSQYTPTDVINYTDDDGNVFTLRIMQCEDDSGIRYVESSDNSATAYNATATGVAPKPPIPSEGSLRGPTAFVAMNLPSLRTSDNVPGAYIAACGYLAGWQGATIYLSADGGVSYQEVAVFTAPSSIGSLTADCTSSSEPISVSMLDGTLSSITSDQLAARLNAFAITTSGVSEVGQFQTQTPTGADAYDLTGTVRPVLNTTAASHATGDSFVMLDTAQFLPLNIGLAGKTLYFKAVTFGTSADSVEAVPFVFNPLFTSISIDTLTYGGEVVTVDGQPIYVVTTNA